MTELTKGQQRLLNEIAMGAREIAANSTLLADTAALAGVWNLERAHREIASKQRLRARIAMGIEDDERDGLRRQVEELTLAISALKGATNG